MGRLGTSKQQSAADGEAALAAAVACLGSVTAAAASHCPAQMGAALVTDLLRLAAEGTLAVRQEALQALQPVALARSDLLCDQWPALKHALSRTSGSHSSHRSGLYAPPISI